MWIKVSPKTMPPDLEDVLVTVINDRCEKDVITNVQWSKYEGIWLCMKSGAYTSFEDCYPGLQITHWMYRPDPAQD